MRVDPLQVLTKLAAAQNIPTRRVTPPFDGLEEFDYGLRRSLDPQFDWQEFGRLLLEQTPAQTLLFVEGTFELHFALFRIPDEENTVFLVGPWTFGPRSEKARKWARRYLGEDGENAVQEYYNGVKLLQANDFYMTIRVLVGMMMGEDLVVKELKEFLPFCFHPDVRYFNEPKFQKDIPISMLEQRYESENRILDAVSRGDDEAATEAMHHHSRFTYGGRFEGSLYQQKNMMIVFNTLLRKAIEPSKVHPYYIDAISSKYARIIEEADEIPPGDDVADGAGLLRLCPPLLAEGVLARRPEGDELRQPERLRAADTEESGGHVLHQPVVSVGAVQAGDRHHPHRLYQHPAGEPCGPAAGAEQPQHRRRSRRSGHSGRELLHQDLQKDPRRHPHPLPPGTQRKITAKQQNEKKTHFVLLMRTDYAPGQSGLFCIG